MAELVGRAEIRVDMRTTDAVRSLQQMAARADGPLRTLKRRVSDVRQELGRLRGASVAVTVDDRTGPGVTAVKAAVRDLERLGPVRIDARVDVQATDIAAASAALRDLKAAAQGAARALRTLSMRAGAAAAALGVLTVQARALRGQLNDLDGSLRNVGSGMGGLRGRIGTVSTSASSAEGSVGGLVTALVSLASAAIPVAAAALPIAANLGAAGVALGAFGGAVAGQIVSLVELKEAEDKAADAAAQHGVTSQEAAAAQGAYRETLNALPPATRRAAVAFGLLTEQYQSWSDALAKDTMPVVTKSMAVFGALLPRLTPLVRGTSTELDRLMSVLGGIVQADAVGRLSNQFAEFASGAISRATTRLAQFTQTANTGAIGENYRAFMAYVRANGPIVSETLGNLGQAAVRLLASFSDLGVSALTVVNALAQLVNAVPSGALSTFIQMAVAVKLLRLGIAGLTAVLASGAVAQLRLFTRAAISGGAASAITGLAQRMTGLQKAALGLGVLAVAAVGINELAKRARGAPPDVDRLSTALKRLVETGKATGEFRKTFGDVDGLVQKIKQLGVETQKAKDAAGGGTGFRIPGLDDLADKVSGAVDDMVKGGESLNALKDDFKSTDQALAGLATSGHADAAADAFDQIKTAARQQGVSLKDVNALFPEYRGAVAALKAEQALVAQGMGLFGQQAQKTSEKLADQKASADGLRQAIVALNDVNRQGIGGMIGFEAAIDAAAKAAKENAGALRVVNGEMDLNSPKAQAAASALNDLGAKTDEAAASAREQGKSWTQVSAIYDRGRDKLIKYIQQMARTEDGTRLTREEAKKLADQFLQIPNKTVTLKGDIEEFRGKIAKAKEQLGDKNLPKKKRTKLEADIADWNAKLIAARADLEKTPDKKIAKLTADSTDWRAKIAAAEVQLRTAKGDKRAKLTANIADWRSKVAAAETQLKKANNEKQANLTANIKDWQSKIKTAETRLKTAKGSKRAKLTADISQLKRKVREAQGDINSLRGRNLAITVSSNVRAATSRIRGMLGSFFAQGGPIGYAGGGKVQGFPHGGPVRGPGTSMSDSIPIMASRGEFMIRAAAVRKYGTGLFKALNSMRVPAHMGPGGTASSGTDAGRQMVQGLIEGMQSQLGALRSAVRDVGQEMADGLTASRPKVAAAAKSVASSASAGAGRSGAGGTSRSAGSGGATARKAQARGGMGAAVAELRSLVLSGRWLKKKSMLFEDMHFLGMSKNYEKHGTKVADRFWSAVQQIKKATAAGKPVPTSGNVAKFADIIAAIWPRGPRGRNFGNFGKFARGGRISGRGTGTSDSIPILASDGEYMVREAAVRRYGPEFFDALNSMRVRPGAVSATAPRSRSAAASTTTFNVTVENHGVLGSQLEVENWLAKSLDRLDRTGRLPAGVGGR